MSKRRNWPRYYRRAAALKHCRVNKTIYDIRMCTYIYIYTSDSAPSSSLPTFCPPNALHPPYYIPNHSSPFPFPLTSPPSHYHSFPPTSPPSHYHSTLPLPLLLPTTTPPSLLPLHPPTTTPPSLLPLHPPSYLSTLPLPLHPPTTTPPSLLPLHPPTTTPLSHYHSSFPLPLLLPSYHSTLPLPLLLPTPYHRTSE